MPIELGLPSNKVGPDEFQVLFQRSLERTRKAFRKIEVHQFFDESGDPSFDKMVAGDWDGAMEELDSIVQDQDELLAPAIRRGVSLTRLRYVSFPLTDYLRWELASYRLSEQIGEKIFISDDSLLRSELPECVVFDDHTLITLDYNRLGQFQGAGVYNSSEDIGKVIARFNDFLSGAVRLEDFLGKQGQHSLTL